ncbi:MAG: hypothetical protein AB8F26_09590 [Phycisphaerales bacterium]
MPTPPAGNKVNVRTVVLVTILSLLVWLLAESRTVRSQVVDLAPSLEIGADARVLTRAATGSDWPDSLRVTLSGSVAGLDQAIRALNGRLTMRVGIDVPTTPGVHDVDLREVLRASETLAAAGVTVEEVDPPRVLIEVDSVSELLIPLRVVVPDGVRFEANGVARTTPTEIRVIGPASVVEKLEDAEGIVRLESSLIASLTPGRASTIAAQRVVLPDGEDRWAMRVEPTQVDVALTLRSRTAELSLPAMPIQIQLAPGEVGRWLIELEPGSLDLVGIVVTGPSDQIERLRSGEIVPTAFLSLGFDELERGISGKPAELHGLPPGIRLVPGQDLEVRLTVQRALEPSIGE